MMCAGDNELMIQIATGDKKAFALLMHRHLPAVLNFSKQYLPQDAEDIAQEAFIRLWNKAPEWQDKGISPKAWLMRVSYNLCIDELRKHKALAMPEQQLELIDPGIADEKLLIAQSDLHQQMLALKSLPERQRSAITLHAYNGLSNQESAAVLNISVDALESLLSRGRRTLRRMLHEQMATEQESKL